MKWRIFARLATTLCVFLIGFLLLALFYPFTVTGQIFELNSGTATIVPGTKIYAIRHPLVDDPRSDRYFELRRNEYWPLNPRGSTSDKNFCSEIGWHFISEYEDSKRVSDRFVYRDSLDDPLADWAKIRADEEYKNLDNTRAAEIRRSFWMYRLWAYSKLKDDQQTSLVHEFFGPGETLESIDKQMLSEAKEIVRSRDKREVQTQSDSNGIFTFQLPRGEYMLVAIGDVRRERGMGNFKSIDSLPATWVMPLRVGYFNNRTIMGDPVCSP
jgi:hypothetical protein